MDRDAMIAEVMRRVGVRLGPNDPVYAVVELNRLALEESVAYLLERISPLANQITTSGVELAAQIARTAARRISEETDAGRKAVAGEAQAARNAAAIAIQQVAQSQQRAHVAQWIFAGIVLAGFLGTVCFTAGYVCAPSLDNIGRVHR
jgi:hypothetical protein